MACRGSVVSGDVVASSGGPASHEIRGLLVRKIVAGSLDQLALIVLDHPPSPFGFRWGGQEPGPWVSGVMDGGGVGAGPDGRWW
jgi:hypothetical protein